LIPGLPPDEDEPAGRTEPEPFTPGYATLLTLCAGLAQLFLLSLFAGTGTVRGELLGISSILAFGGAFAIGCSRLPAPPAEHLGIAHSPRLAWIAAGLLVPSVILASEVDNLFRSLLGGGSLATGAPALEPAALAGWALFLIVVRPLVDELFFRGLLQGRLIEHFGVRGGIVSTALLAALAIGFLNPWAVALTLTLSLLLGMLRFAAGSVVPGIALNAAFGASSVLSLMSSFGIPGFDDPSADHTPLAWLAMAAIPTGAGLRICVALLRARLAAPAEAGPTDAP